MRNVIGQKANTRAFFCLVLVAFILYLCYLFIYATFGSHFMFITEQIRLSQKLGKTK